MVLHTLMANLCVSVFHKGVTLSFWTWQCTCLPCYSRSFFSRCFPVFFRQYLCRCSAQILWMVMQMALCIFPPCLTHFSVSYLCVVSFVVFVGIAVSVNCLHCTVTESAHCTALKIKYGKGEEAGCSFVVFLQWIQEVVILYLVVCTFCTFFTWIVTI